MAARRSSRFPGSLCKPIDLYRAGLPRHEERFYEMTARHTIFIDILRYARIHKEVVTAERRCSMGHSTKVYPGSMSLYKRHILPPQHIARFPETARIALNCRHGGVQNSDLQPVQTLSGRCWTFTDTPVTFVLKKCQSNARHGTVCGSCLAFMNLVLTA